MPDSQLQILMLASENDAIPGAKVGGIGDVVRDVPKALCQLRHQVSVVIPSYGKFHQFPTAEKIATLSVRFRQQHESVDVYTWQGAGEQTPGLRYWLLEHELFSLGGHGQIYCDDPDWAPFESDASKFALFCQACAEAIHQQIFGILDVVHLHDWHAAFYAVLREFDLRYQAQKALRCVFTLHNLALQGIRPLAGSDSALNSWYPWLPYDREAVSDPRWEACINPVASAIRLCDKTHTVSPSYALEIQQPNAVESRGFHGGEGLEQLLHDVADAGKLTGILNGCDYSDLESADIPGLPWPNLLEQLVAANQRWIVQSTSLQTRDYLADRTLQNWQRSSEPAHIVTSIGRLTEQKVSLLTQALDNGGSPLESMLRRLGSTTQSAGRGVFVLLGTGDPDYEQRFTDIAARFSNFLFLNHFDQSVAQALYASGSLFVMPSSYEPCGISQMLAMKYSQPCLVHAVGGLKDTVEDHVTGFHFSGDTLDQQAQNLVSRFSEVLSIAERQPERWQQIRQATGAQRFEWEKAARLYESQLYQ